MFAQRRATNLGILRTLAAALVLTACASAPPLASSTPAPDPEPLSIGPAATDTVGGWLPDDMTMSPFDVSNPIVGWLDPALLRAVQDAAHAAAAEGIDMQINSGWRSKGFQKRLFDAAISTYGSVDATRKFVATPEVSKHVEGLAVDIAPIEADKWLILNGPRFGLCQIYANEIWHFELATDEHGRCPPLKPNAAAG